jgi:hypothetical protein
MRLPKELYQIPPNKPDQKSSFTPSWMIRGALALRTYPKFDWPEA